MAFSSLQTLTSFHPVSANERHFRISKGIIISTYKDSKKTRAIQVYWLEELVNKAWSIVLTLPVDPKAPEATREALVSHICTAIKAAEPNEPVTKKTSKDDKPAAMDIINDNIDTLEEQVTNILKNIEMEDSEETEGVSRKGKGKGGK